MTEYTTRVLIDEQTLPKPNDAPTAKPAPTNMKETRTKAAKKKKKKAAKSSEVEKSIAASSTGSKKSANEVTAIIAKQVEETRGEERQGRSGGSFQDRQEHEKGSAR